MLYAIQGLLKHHEVNTNLASAISLEEDKKMGSTVVIISLMFW